MKNSIIKLIKDLGFGFTLSGKPDCIIKDISLIHFVREYDLCYLDANIPQLVKDKTNITLICPLDFDESNPSITYIKTKDPKLLFYYVSSLFGNNETFKVQEIIPTSDHTATVIYEKNTLKYLMDQKLL